MYLLVNFTTAFNSVNVMICGVLDQFSNVTSALLSISRTFFVLVWIVASFVVSLAFSSVRRFSFVNDLLCIHFLKLHIWSLSPSLPLLIAFIIFATSLIMEKMRNAR